jgi:hypothetical protein
VTGRHEQPVDWGDTIKILHSSMFLLVHKRSEYIFYHSAQILDLHERKATDIPVLFPADQGEFISRPDGCFFPYIFWEYHLSTIVNTQYSFYITPGSLVTTTG